jgi:signal transduction histidine kinase
VSVAVASVADLRPVDLFDDLPDDELAAFAAIAEVRDVPDGEIVAEVGEPPPGLICLLAGRLANSIVVEGRLEPAGRQESPTWSGAIAVLTEGDLGVRMVADGPCRVALLPPEPFRRLALEHPPVHRRIMLQVQPVMQRITSWEQDRERLASLGTMAAGLAHELNNPAAAARRAASSMCEVLDVLSSVVGRFVESGVERSAAGELVALQQEALARARGRTQLDALDAADAEDELQDLLEELGVDDAWRLAEPLAAAGLDQTWLERVADSAGSALPSALEWVAASLTARGLAGELRDSAERMSNLVGAVKTYAYMDRGGVVEVDVHEGLETTLVVLGHKLKHTDIEVVRDYDRALPRITVHGSELNQVWTNLLDNAIAALGDRGTITLRTRRDGACVLVDVADDGPGIPPDVVDRVFDPFFTTKGVGEGTGLGLDTARRIVADHHEGAITVDSAPGATTFHVWLPIKE